MFYNNYEKSMRQNNYIVPEDESVIKTILKVSEAYSVDDVKGYKNIIFLSRFFDEG